MIDWKIPVILGGMSDKSSRYIDHELIAAIDKYIAEREGMTASAFGTQSINDPALYADLKEGRELRRATRERILTFIGASQESFRIQPLQGLNVSSGSQNGLKKRSSASRTSTATHEAGAVK